MGLSPPVFVCLIVLATVVPPLIAGALLSRFVCRNFRDAAGAVEPRPQRRWFGLRHVKFNATDTGLAARAQSYADSWQDLESLRTYRDTPTPSIHHCIHEQARFAPSPLQPLSETWHPSRASRLTWSFSPTRVDQRAPRSSHNRSRWSRDSGIVLEGEDEDQKARDEQALKRTRV
ncbi:hypothetical protein EsH8_VIII_000593 [Colletotrichum jinshuiense]